MQLDFDLVLVGPHVENVECTLGVPCNIEVEQIGLYWTTSIAVLLNGSQDCLSVPGRQVGGEVAVK